MVTPAKDKAERKARRKEEGRPVRGDRKAGYGKDKPPKGGRNAGGRGGKRST